MVQLAETSEKLKATDGPKHTLQMEYQYKQIHMKQFELRNRVCTIFLFQCHYGPVAYPFNEYIPRTKQRMKRLSAELAFQSNQNVCILGIECTSSSITWYC